MSLLTSFSEVQDVVHNKLRPKRQANNILAREQFSVTKGLFTENAGFKLTDNVLKRCYPKNACWRNIL
jgi:hypothetical protein